MLKGRRLKSSTDLIPARMHVILTFLKKLNDWLGLYLGRIRQWVAQPFSGYLLLVLSILISLTQVYYVYYNIGDEGDTFAVGWLIANKWSLYRDVFSHHFPFSYLWVAGVVKVFGSSLFAVRFSLILLRSFVLLLAMKVSRYHFAVGLTGLAWSILGYLYLGNELLYQSFSGFFIVGAFIMSLAVIQRDIEPRKVDLLMIGSLTGLAVMTDPLMGLPAIVLITFTSLSGFSNRPAREGLRIGFSTFCIVLGGSIAIFSIVFVYLFLNSSLQGFYQEGILFNTQIYAKYTEPITVKDVFRPFMSLLDLFNVQWRYYTSPFYKWDTFEFLDNWIFTGFFFRFAILVGSMITLIRRKFLATCLIYLLGSTIIIRSTHFFHASPFVLFSLCCSSLVISKDLGGSNLQSRRSTKEIRDSVLSIGANAFAFLGRLILFIAFLWLNVRGAGFLFENKEKLGFTENFGALEGNAGFLANNTCHIEQARVLVYPLDPIQYFLAEIPPASRYHFMTPWVADVGQGEVISDLHNGPFLVYVNRDANIWGFPVEEYLGELLRFLDEQFIQVETNYYLSPQLQRLCPY
jgi:hypothetical protein